MMTKWTEEEKLVKLHWYLNKNEKQTQKFFVLKVKSEWKIPTKPFQSRLSFIYSFIDVTSEVKPRVF